MINNIWNMDNNSNSNSNSNIKWSGMCRRQERVNIKRIEWWTRLLLVERRRKQEWI